jgi:Inner membrane protein YgaP-like, transmembrane domain
MNSERLIRIIAGSFILLSLVLAHIYNGVNLMNGPTWLWFTAFVGANLLQSGFTRWCLMEQLLKKAGVKSGCVQLPGTY